MKIEDIVRITGRGYVFIGEPEKYVHLGDKVRKDDAEFEIVGVERFTFMKKVGLILSPNESAHEMIKIGDEVEIIDKEK